jgi:hypothetical protein
MSINVFDPLHNAREISKELVLLEDHLHHPAKHCPDCVNKHLLRAEAFAEEAVGLDTEGQFLPQLHGAVTNIRSLLDEYHAGTEAHQLAQKVRTVRKNMVKLSVSQMEPRQQPRTNWLKGIQAGESALFHLSREQTPKAFAGLTWANRWLSLPVQAKGQLCKNTTVTAIPQTTESGAKAVGVLHSKGKCMWIPVEDENNLPGLIPFPPKQEKEAVRRFGLDKAAAAIPHVSNEEKHKPAAAHSIGKISPCPLNSDGGFRRTNLFIIWAVGARKCPVDALTQKNAADPDIRKELAIRSRCALIIIAASLSGLSNASKGGLFSHRIVDGEASGNPILNTAEIAKRILDSLNPSVGLGKLLSTGLMAKDAADLPRTAEIVRLILPLTDITLSGNPWAAKIVECADLAFPNEAGWQKSHPEPARNLREYAMGSQYYREAQLLHPALIPPMAAAANKETKARLARKESKPTALILFREAAKSWEKLALASNDSWMAARSAWLYLMARDPAKALPMIALSLRTDPSHPILTYLTGKQRQLKQQLRLAPPPHKTAVAAVFRLVKR